MIFGLIKRLCCSNGHLAWLQSEGVYCLVQTAGSAVYVWLMIVLQWFGLHEWDWRCVKGRYAPTRAR
jgi:hypothetical protein